MWEKKEKKWKLRLAAGMWLGRALWKLLLLRPCQTRSCALEVPALGRIVLALKEEFGSSWKEQGFTQQERWGRTTRVWDPGRGLRIPNGVGRRETTDSPARKKGASRRSWEIRRRSSRLCPENKYQDDSDGSPAAAVLPSGSYCARPAVTRRRCHCTRG